MQKDFLLNEGIEAVKQKDFSRAHELLKHALKLDQNNVEGWLWYARIQGDPEKRMRCVERALQIDPTHPEALRFYTQLKNASQRKTATMQAITQTSSMRAITAETLAADAKRQTGQLKRKTATTNRVPKDLGEVLTTSSLNASGLLWRAAIVLVTGAFAIWALFLSNFLETVRSITSLEMLSADPIPVVAVGLSFVALPIAAWNLARLLLTLPQGIAVKEYGLEVFNLGATRLTYRDVETVHLRYHRDWLRRPRYRLELRTTSGKRILIHHIFSNAHTVIEAILHRVGPVMGQRLGELVLHGEVLRFEDERVEVDRDGISRGPKLIAWADIHSVTINPKGRAVVDSSYQGTLDVLVDGDAHLPIFGYIARYISARQVSVQFDF